MIALKKFYVNDDNYCFWVMEMCFEFHYGDKGLISLILLPTTKQFQHREAVQFESPLLGGYVERRLPLPQEVRWSHVLNYTFPSWYISSSSCSCSQQQGGVTAVQLQTEAQVASASGQQVQTLQVVVPSLILCKHCMKFSCLHVWCYLW